MSPAAAARYLQILGFVSILLAALFALAVRADPTGANDLFFHIASAGDAGLDGIATPEARLALAIAGGIFAGFSGFIVFVVAPEIAKGNARAARGALWALATWFVIDSAASVLGGNAQNAALNLALLAAYALPLVLVKFDQPA